MSVLAANSFASSSTSPSSLPSCPSSEPPTDTDNTATRPRRPLADVARALRSAAARHASGGPPSLRREGPRRRRGPRRVSNGQRTTGRARSTLRGYGLADLDINTLVAAIAGLLGGGGVSVLLVGPMAQQRRDRRNHLVDEILAPRGPTSSPSAERVRLGPHTRRVICRRSAKGDLGRGTQAPSIRLEAIVDGARIRSSSEVDP